MRILYVINSLGPGGTERSMAVLLPALRARGVEVRVVCLLHAEDGDERQLLDDGFDITFVTASDWLGRVRSVRRAIRSFGPDVVHSMIFEADVVTRFAAIGSGVQVVSSLVSTPYDPIRRQDPMVTPWRLDAVRLVDSWTGRLLVDHFHAVTPGVRLAAAEQLHLRSERITVVERGREATSFPVVTRERRREARRRLGLDDDDDVVLAVGRQVFAKDHELLIRAFDVVAEDRPRALLLIAGSSGNASREVESAHLESVHRDRISLLGYRNDVADLLAAADVFAMPSRYEGTAGAAIEAMASGVPIVATAVMGLEGVLVDSETALVVPVGDQRALADAIGRVLGDPGLARSLTTRSTAEFRRRFDPERSADRMVALYGRIAGDRIERAAVPPVSELDEPGEIDLTVIVPVRNEMSTLLRQLNVLAAEEWDRAWEVLVVDNDSDDGSFEMALKVAARDPRFRVIRATLEHSLSFGRNEGVRYARGAAVAFCDADDVVGEGWVAAMGKALVDHPVVASKLVYERLSEPAALVGRATFQSEGIEKFFGLPVVNGASGWQRWLWEELGGNDRLLRYAGEDIDMSLRAHVELGIEPWFVDEATYHCARRAGAASTLRQARRYGRAQVELYRRWGRGRVDVRSEVARAMHMYWWLVRTLPRLALAPDQRTLWAWRFGMRVGRAQESLRSLTLYP